MKKLGLIILTGIIGILLVKIPLAIAPSQGLIVNILPSNLTVYSPEEKLYEFRMIPFNLTMLEEAKYFRYSDNGGKSRVLCRRCDEYGYSKLKRKPFDDGFHELLISAEFDNWTAYYYVNFTVDTLPPKITKTEPRRGFANGSFSAEFQEANPEEMWILYGNETDKRNQEVNLDSCIQNKRNRKKCNVNVDLSEFDGQEIVYWFNMTDIAGNYDESRKREVKVDYSAPRIDYFNYSQNRRKVTFVFNVTEPNFDEINYIDWEKGNRARWRLLCSRVKDGYCEKTKSFSRGEHNLTIEIADEVGNMVQINGVVFGV